MYIYGNGHQVRDVLNVRDLVRAFGAAYDCREKTAGQIYNIGGGRGNTISLLELIKRLEHDLHLRMKYRHRPARVGDQPIYVTDFRKFSEHTGWRPLRSVQDTVHDIRDWYKQNESLFAPAPFIVPAAKEQPQLIRGLAS